MPVTTPVLGIGNSYYTKTKDLIRGNESSKYCKTNVLKIYLPVSKKN